MEEAAVDWGQGREGSKTSGGAAEVGNERNAARQPAESRDRPSVGRRSSHRTGLANGGFLASLCWVGLHNGTQMEKRGKSRRPGENRHRCLLGLQAGRALSATAALNDGRIWMPSGWCRERVCGK